MIHLAFLLALYLLPTLIASGRGLYQRTAIAMLNIFLGWTFIGWVAALIWALTAPAPCEYYAHPPCPPYPSRWR